jgi:hypothetical protein
MAKSPGQIRDEFDRIPLAILRESVLPGAVIRQHFL